MFIKILVDLKDFVSETKEYLRELKNQFNKKKYSMKKMMRQYMFSH